jgi:hypothetical protein
MAEIKVRLSDDEKVRLEIEAKRLGVSSTALFRLFMKSWFGEIQFTRQPDNQKDVIQKM